MTENGRTEPQEDEEDEEEDVGVPVQPASCLKSLLCFLLVSISAGVMYNASYVFLPSMTTTLERRFGFDSEDTGRLLVANDIGFASTVTLVSFYGNRGHRPRVLGLGAVVMGLSTAAYSLPYLIYGPKYTEKEIAKFVALSERRNVSSNSESAFLCTTAPRVTEHPSAPLLLSDHTTKTAATPPVVQDVRDIVFAIFMAVGILQGAASAPSWSVLFTMVEDSAAKARSPIYIGLVITARSISPMLGYYIVAQFLATHESFQQDSGLRETDSLWIGNWWLGFLTLGLLTSALGCPMLLFPRQLEDRACCTTAVPATRACGSRRDCDSPPVRRRSCQSLPTGGSPAPKLLHSLRDLAMSAKRTMTNAILMLVMLSCVVSLLGSGLEVLFIVKYYENYFNVLPSVAGQYVGVTYALPTALATFFGGYLVSRLKLDVVGMMRLICGIFFVTTALNSPAFFLDCPSEAFDIESHVINSCSHRCSCDATFVNSLPVCGADGRLYLSPCHAGCTEAVVDDANATKQASSLFINCGCLQPSWINATTTSRGAARTARAGACLGLCTMVYPFSILKFISHFVDGLSFVSWFLLVMRVTDSKDDEATGVGIISLFFSLAASIMGGFCGKIYESACLVATSGGSQRNCLLYDKRKLRILFNGIPMLARLPYFVLLFAAYLLIRRRFRGGGDSGGDDGGGGGDGGGDGSASIGNQPDDLESIEIRSAT